MMTYNFDLRRDVISNCKNLTTGELVPYRVVKLDPDEVGGVVLAGALEVAVLGILMPSTETTDGKIPSGRACDVVIGGEYLVEIAGDVKTGDLLVVADSTGRVRALTSEEIGVISGDSDIKKIGVIGIAKETANFESGKSVKVVCLISRNLIDIAVS